MQRKSGFFIFKTMTEEIKLNSKQTIFANAILDGKTNREAFMLAGYKYKNQETLDSSSSKLLSNSKVAQFIEIKQKELQEKAEIKLEISREWVLAKYKEVAERCNQDVVPVLNKKGEPVLVEDKNGNMCEAYIFNAKGVVSALDGIARLQGYNAPAKFEGNVKHSNLEIDFSSVSADSLIQLSKALKRIENVQFINDGNSKN